PHDVTRSVDRHPAFEMHAERKTMQPPGAGQDLQRVGVSTTRLKKRGSRGPCGPDSPWVRPGDTIRYFFSGIFTAVTNGSPFASSRHTSVGRSPGFRVLTDATALSSTETVLSPISLLMVRALPSVATETTSPEISLVLVAEALSLACVGSAFFVS